VQVDGLTKVFRVAERFAIAALTRWFWRVGLRRYSGASA